MHKVLLVEKIHQMGTDLLKEGAEVFVAADTKKETLVEAVKGKDAIIIRSSKLFNEVIDAGDSLKVIGRHGIGVDNIDVEYATSKNIAVINTPLANVNSVAEHVIAMMMAVSKKALVADKAMREGKTSVEGKSLPALVQLLDLVGVELAEKTVGVVGYGKIGSLTAAKCIKGFDMKVLVYDPPVQGKIDLPEGAKWVNTLDELLINSDYVSLNVPFNPSTKDMIGKAQLEMMKQSAFLINCARGGIVDEDALYTVLKEKRIAGAAFDVFAVEPPAKDCPLFELDNILLSPHSAAMTEESLQRMAKEVSHGVLTMLGGEEPYNLVNKK